ncbi:MAG: nucleotidyltransferase family protein [Oscillospiraceae bacterium]
MKNVKICAVICEYNPFHNGHQYLLSKIRENGATHIICIMSGNFVERCQPSLLPKDIRTKTALMGGADLVLELPLPYAIDTAERFAFGGAEIIKSLGCVDNIGFGCECDNCAILSQTAHILTSDDFSNTLKKHLSSGISFADARQKAVAEVSFECSKILENPNNILAVEYLKQLSTTSIQPIAIKREGANHNDNHIISNTASATFIRDNLEKPEIRCSMPEYSYELLMECLANGNALIDKNKFELLMLSKLRTLSIEDLTKLPNISEGLEYKLFNSIQYSATISELFELAKSKRYSHARIRRIALCGFLGIENGLSKLPIPYIRVLGMNKNGEEILSVAKSRCKIPISHSLKRLECENNICKKFTQLENSSTNQYNLLLENPKKSNSDLQFSPIKL